MGYPTWVGFALFNLAEEKGIFEKHGIKVNLSVIDDESQYASAMISNSIQAIAHVIDREIVNYSSGATEQAVVGIDESLGADGLIATKEIQSIADLKNKTVAVCKSSTSYFLLLTMLEKNGIDPSELTLEDLQPSDAGAAFLAGKVDAAVTWEPWLSQASQREGGHLLASSKDYPNTIVDVVCFSSKFIEENPTTVQNFVDAWYETMAYYEANPDESSEIMGKAMGISTDEFKAQMEGVHMLNQEDNQKLFDASSSDSLLSLTDRASNFWTKLKIMDKAVTSQEFVNTSFYQGSN